MAERVATNSEVPSSSPRLGSNNKSVSYSNLFDITLVISNHEDMAAALHAFINRYNDVCEEYNKVLKENRNV